MLARKRHWTSLASWLAWGHLLFAGPPETEDRPTLQQLVNNSDLIVIGAFRSAVADSSAKVPHSSRAVTTGSVGIEELLWGDMVSFLMGEVIGEEEIAVEWQHSPEVVPPVTGRRGIWLLVKTPAGSYRAGEGRLLEVKQRRKVRRSLRKDMVILRPGRFQPAAGRVVELVFRNAHRRDALVPEYRFEEGLLHLHPRVTLTVQAVPPDRRSRPVAIAPLAGRMQMLDDEDEIVVQSGEDYLVSLDLEELFNLDRRTHYEVQFQVRQYGESTLTLPPIP